MRVGVGETWEGTFVSVTGAQLKSRISVSSLEEGKSKRKESSSEF